MKCYQIDFDDGSRILVDANTEAEARKYAIEQADGDAGLRSCVCLNEE